MDKQRTLQADPLGDYFNHLLSCDGEVQGQQVNWDYLLHEAVSPYHLQEALDSSTLAPGFEPVSLEQAGDGDPAQRRAQLFDLLRLAGQLPPGRLKGMILHRSQRCLAPGGLNG